MPNWCFNSLTVSPIGRGKKAKGQLKAFKKFVKAKKSCFSFESILPYPQHFIEQDNAMTKWEKRIPKELEGTPNRKEWIKKHPAPYKTDGYNSGGYEWCVANWGTKWNACEPSLEEYKNELNYTFETAWSPPCQVIYALSRRFPLLNLELYYEEGGMGFKGNYVCERGNVVEDSQDEITYEEEDENAE
jgi:hypothetical protein